MLIPNEDDPTNFSVKVNGERVEEPVKLEHGDRILVGSHHYYLFVDPQVNNEEQVEWEEAMKEANKEQLAMAAAADQEEEERKLREIEEKVRADKEEKERLIKEQ